MNSRKPLHVLVCAFVGIASHGYCQEITETPAPIIEYERSPETLLIRMISFSNYFQGSSVLRVFGDGRVLIERNRSEKSFYEWRMKPQEIDALLQFMHDHGAMTYPYGIVTQRLKEEANRRRAATVPGQRIEHAAEGEPSDGTTTKVELFLKAFKSPTSDRPVQKDFYHLTGGYALGYIAQTLPEMEEAQDLAAIVQKLSELSKNPKRRPLSQSQADVSLPLNEPAFPE